MKIVHCVHSTGEMTVVIVSDSPYGEIFQVVEDVQRVFVSEPDVNKIEVVKNE